MTDARTKRRIVRFYLDGHGGIEATARKFEVYEAEVRKILTENGVEIHHRGRLAVTKAEWKRRAAVALESSSWEDYRKRLGFPETYHVQNHVVYGVKIGCSRCHLRPAVRSVHGDPKTRVCRPCAAELKTLAKPADAKAPGAEAVMA